MDGWTKAGLTIAVVALAGGGGAIAWSFWDLNTNYSPVRATVVAVAEECTLERTSYDQHDNPIRDRKGPMACGEAERLRRAGSTYSGFGLHRQPIVKVGYVSPADGRPHVGEIRPRAGYLAKAAPGAEVDILAHKRSPEEISLQP